MHRYYLTLLAYEQWANNRIISALKAAPSLTPRLIELVSHIIIAQRTWYNRTQNLSSMGAVWQAIPPQNWDAIHEQTMRQWLMYIKNAPSLNLKIKYATTTGEVFETPLSEILTHLTHHSAYHRGQIIELLKEQSLEEIPATDYIVYLRETKKA